MDEINGYVIYNERYSALICLTCGYALNADGIENHLRRKHKDVPMSSRKRIQDWTDTLVIKGPKDIEIPDEEITAIEGLKVIDGFICLNCDALYGSTVSMVHHCQDKHGWRSWKGIALPFASLFSRCYKHIAELKYR